jgi:hypothetical protein
MHWGKQTELDIDLGTFQESKTDGATLAQALKRYVATVSVRKAGLVIEKPCSLIYGSSAEFVGKSW